MRTAFDTKPIQSFTKNNGFRRWIVHEDVMVALTHLGRVFGRPASADAGEKWTLGEGE